MSKKVNSNPLIQHAEESEERYRGQERDDRMTEELEYEIECPRCHDLMTLTSEFDSLHYICGNCDFALYTINKNLSI